MQPPKSAICVICGVRPATTVEHVPPKCFFKGSRDGLRTVPACSVCNNGSSDDDEALRNALSIQIGKPTEAARDLWEKGAYRSLTRSPKLRGALTQTLHQVTVADAVGASTPRLAFLIPIALYQREFERVTRGLHFFHTGQILPAETPVMITVLDGPIDRSALPVLEDHSVAHGAFQYSYWLAPSRPEHGFWLFTLHDAQWPLAGSGALVD